MSIRQQSSRLIKFYKEAKAILVSINHGYTHRGSIDNAGSWLDGPASSRSDSGRKGEAEGAPIVSSRTPVFNQELLFSVICGIKRHSDDIVPSQTDFPTDSLHRLNAVCFLFLSCFAWSAPCKFIDRNDQDSPVLREINWILTDLQASGRFMNYWSARNVSESSALCIIDTTPCYYSLACE